VVEKILEPGEGLPINWPVQGTTGYDFLAIVNNVFTNKNSKERFTDFYTRLVNDDRTIHQQLHDKKAYILHENMGGELSNLHQLFSELNLADKEALDTVQPELLKEAIGEFLIQCPVYRYYGNQLPLKEQEAGDVLDIFNRIVKSKPELEPAVQLLSKQY
jgi:maltooligosyltrehalose synthase